MDIIGYLLLFFVSFSLSAILIPLMIKIALKFNVLDKPDSHLKDHQRPIPYLGGVVLFVSFIFPLLLWKIFVYPDFTIKGITGISIGATIIFLVGLIDDLKKLSVYTKFLVEIIVAFLLILVNIKIEFIKPEIFGYILTILWIVGITNSLNIIDIMDGLAGGVVFISSITFFIISIIGFKVFSPIIALALAGSTLGFLVYNFSPAKIFMGDAGSLFLGFVLASLSLTESYSGVNKFAVLSPLLILIVPIFDTIFVMFVRFKKGISVFKGSPDHFPIRLTKLGLSRKKVVLIIYVISIIFCILAIISILVTTLYAVIIYVLAIISIIYFSRFFIKIGL